MGAQVKVSNAAAAAFCGRLSELLAGEPEAVELVITDDTELGINEEGRAFVSSCGAEAILIVRGPEDSRKLALARLLASIESQQ